jgi:hypothetical protein
MCKAVGLKYEKTEKISKKWQEVALHTSIIKGRSVSNNNQFGLVWFQSFDSLTTGPSNTRHHGVEKNGVFCER